MSDDKSLRLKCPECDAELVVDSTTGQLLYHKKAKETPAGGQTFESLMQDLEDGKRRSEDVFEQEKAALKDQDRLLDEKFREAMSRADEADVQERPLRPFDLD